MVVFEENKTGACCVVLSVQGQNSSWVKSELELQADKVSM